MKSRAGRSRVYRPRDGSLIRSMLSMDGSIEKCQNAHVAGGVACNLGRSCDVVNAWDVLVSEGRRSRWSQSPVQQRL